MPRPVTRLIWRRHSLRTRFLKSDGRQLCSTNSNQLRFHIRQLDRLVAVIRDHEKDRHETDVGVTDGENFRLVVHIVWVDCDRDVFGRVRVVRRIIGCGLGMRHGELLGGKANRGSSEYQQAYIQIPERLGAEIRHGNDYRMRAYISYAVRPMAVQLK